MSQTRPRVELPETACVQGCPRTQKPLFMSLSAFDFSLTCDIPLVNLGPSCPVPGCMSLIGCMPSIHNEERRTPRPLELRSPARTVRALQGVRHQLEARQADDPGIAKPTPQWSIWKPVPPKSVGTPVRPMARIGVPMVPPRKRRIRRKTGPFKSSDKERPRLAEALRKVVQGLAHLVGIHIVL